MAEWPNVPDSKSGVPQGTVGSNPTLSAKVLFSNVQQGVLQADACWGYRQKDHVLEPAHWKPARSEQHAGQVIRRFEADVFPHIPPWADQTSAQKVGSISCQPGMTGSPHHPWPWSAQRRLSSHHQTSLSRCDGHSSRRHDSLQAL